MDLSGKIPRRPPDRADCDRDPQKVASLERERWRNNGTSGRSTDETGNPDRLKNDQYRRQNYTRSQANTGVHAVGWGLKLQTLALAQADIPCLGVIHWYP